MGGHVLCYVSPYLCGALKTDGRFEMKKSDSELFQESVITRVKETNIRDLEFHHRQSG